LLYRMMTLVLAGLLAFTSALPAGERGNESDAPRRVVETGPDGLPKFRHPYDNGLYSTVTAMNTFGVPELEKQQKLKLKEEISRLSAH